jgi:hypothetical protein
MDSWPKKTSWVTRVRLRLLLGRAFESRRDVLDAALRQHILQAVLDETVLAEKCQFFLIKHLFFSSTHNDNAY